MLIPVRPFPQVASFDKSLPASAYHIHPRPVASKVPHEEQIPRDIRYVNVIERDKVTVIFVREAFCPNAERWNPPQLLLKG